MKETVAKPGAIGADTSWFDARAFRRPTGARFGTTGRNIMVGPGIVNLDMSLFRTFKFSERLSLEFKAECFNISNTPKFSNPSANVASMSLNGDGSIRALNNYSSITSTLGGLSTPSERQFRFGLRWSSERRRILRSNRSFGTFVAAAEALPARRCHGPAAVSARLLFRWRIRAMHAAPPFGIPSRTNHNGIYTC